MNPDTKIKLRKKNHLMRAGRLEEAGALATRISKDITRQNTNLLSKSNVRTEPKELWNAVQQLTGRKQETRAVEGINARTLIPTMPTPPLIEVIRYHRENPPLHILASSHAYQSGKSAVDKVRFAAY